jgi:hypothetical protein
MSLELRVAVFNLSRAIALIVRSLSATMQLLATSPGIANSSPFPFFIRIGLARNIFRKTGPAKPDAACENSRGSHIENRSKKISFSARIRSHDGSAAVSKTSACWKLLRNNFDT